ncbi:MAG: hypothetical protein Q9214_001358 [Letrouitia sp. 1 TL-2023]
MKELGLLTSNVWLQNHIALLSRGMCPVTASQAQDLTPDHEGNGGRALKEFTDEHAASLGSNAYDSSDSSTDSEDDSSTSSEDLDENYTTRETYPNYERAEDAPPETRDERLQRSLATGSIEFTALLTARLDEQMKFMYEALAKLAGQQSFRVMTLLPGKAYDPISCEMQVYDLSSAPDYEALSYCWGKDEEAYISISGRALRVTRNLKKALTYLRRKNRPRKLWIDSICINQSDNDEKSLQVLLMRDIYRRATRTVVWLSELKRVEPHESATSFRCEDRPGDSSRVEPFVLCKVIVAYKGAVDFHSPIYPVRQVKRSLDVERHRKVYEEAFDTTYTGRDRDEFKSQLEDRGKLPTWAHLRALH